MKLLPTKGPDEVVPISFDFTADISSGATVTVISVTASVVSGADASPGNLLQGAAIATGATVVQWIKGGVSGVGYAVQCLVSASDGQTLALTSRVDVG
jgi:hypothetical protein